MKMDETLFAIAEKVPYHNYNTNCTGIDLKGTSLVRSIFVELEQKLGIYSCPKPSISLLLLEKSDFYLLIDNVNRTYTF